MNRKFRKIGIIITILIIFNLIFSGCINSPPSNNEQPTLEKYNNIEIPENEDVQNKTTLEDQNTDNGKINVDIKDIEPIIPVNIEENNNSITMDQKDNNSETPKNLEDINETNSKELEDNNKTILEGLNNVIEANNQFALELYLELIKNDNENIFFSPFSISTALVITYENKENKVYQLNTANALWAERNYKFLAEYFSIIEKYYGGNVTNLDFINDPEGSRKIINSWVENQTNNKIKDLIPKGFIDALTRLVITNAIYFKGNWKFQFNEKDTSEQDFYIDTNESVKVPMMYLEEKFNYTNTKEFQILELPYDGDELSMLILLPKNNNLSTIESSINTKNLTNWKNNLTETKIRIHIPKFKFETKYLMVKILMELGMITPFTYKADFSGMDGTNNLFISSVIHQAFIEVNEEGTEAAAATAVVIEYLCESPPTPVFRADHPFIFLIQHRGSGNILFMGKVVIPTK
jgi:serpin B